MYQVRGLPESKYLFQDMSFCYDHSYTIVTSLINVQFEIPSVGTYILFDYNYIEYGVI